MIGICFASRQLLTSFVYHLPKSFGNFGWSVNGKAILVFPTGKFRKISERLERESKISNRNF